MSADEESPGALSSPRLPTPKRACRVPIVRVVSGVNRSGSSRVPRRSDEDRNPIMYERPDRPSRSQQSSQSLRSHSLASAASSSRSRMIVDAVEIPIFNKVAWRSESSGWDVSAAASPPESQAPSEPNTQLPKLRKRKRKDSANNQPHVARGRSTVPKAVSIPIQKIRVLRPRNLKVQGTTCLPSGSPAHNGSENEGDDELDANMELENEGSDELNANMESENEGDDELNASMEWEEDERPKEKRTFEGKGKGKAIKSQCLEYLHPRS